MVSASSAPPKIVAVLRALLSAIDDAQSAIAATGIPQQEADALTSWLAIAPPLVDPIIDTYAPDDADDNNPAADLAESAGRRRLREAARRGPIYTFEED